ncbi:MAG: SIS domain-containing protein [Actinomycetota bacterium]|nr:SIS domain-containing protein [Actinomycetota bacterium]
MCGIIAVVSRRSTRPFVDPVEVLARLDSVAVSIADDPDAALSVLRSVDAALRGVPGVTAGDVDPGLTTSIVARLPVLEAVVDVLETRLGDDVGPDDPDTARVTGLRDVLWAIRHDRVRTIDAVLDLAGRSAGSAAIAAYLSVQQALSALDRLEVRGRDSAGLHLYVSDHGLDANDPGLLAEIDRRCGDPLFQNTSVRLITGAAGPVLSFVYKAAAEIGELGDNTSAIRSAILQDSLLRRALRAEKATMSVLGHTRWASVGVISEPNAHPLNSEELETPGEPAPYVVAALNGDVDNHADLRVRHGLRIHSHITTDAKVIPSLMARSMTQGNTAVEAFRRTVSEFEGSVAIGAIAADDPGRLLLALRGSGQGLFVGFADDCTIVASEPYGIVEETDRYLRLEGEAGGEIVVVDAADSGTVAGIRRLSYDGTEMPVGATEVQVAEVTTRDIDRGDAPHFLLKEISESPTSLRKTLRGRIVDADGHLVARLDERSLPRVVRERLATGAIRRVRVIGQGTAAVAGQSTAAILDELCAGALDVSSITATELSGFHLRPNMSDTLAIAVSQSGTTTDTNRTVDLLRARGAAVIGIVNRRGSDLVDKSDGVVYTSDGRDVEMSVASTKAFYAQVAAGAVLACAIADTAGLGDQMRRHRLLSSLSELPAAMETVLTRRESIAEVAHRLAPTRRYWAVVGNGPNRVAANEVRIKLSELCYKSIASDVTEDKKHIDLSSEPLIFVCAAGLQGSTADDVAKETAIFRAHRALPVVVADEGETRFSSAATIEVPAVDPALGFVLSAMVGHIFGYEAARAIDASADPLRRAREAVEHAVAEHDEGDAVLAELREALVPLAAEFTAGLRAGRYDGHLEASTAVRLFGMFGHAMSERPVEDFSIATGKVGTPSLLVDDLVAALTAAIEELTRPIDAIKHQAKTVTVGISRSDSEVLDRALVRAVLDAGAGRDVLSYRTLKVLAALDPAVATVTGFTRYAVEGTSLAVVDRGGISRDLPSRVEGDPTLRGTKRHVADNREVLVARGRRDSRIVIFVPESKGGVCTGITLLHVSLHDQLSVGDARTCLAGYDHRYDRLVDWVTETEGSFDESLLATIPTAELLIDPISETADHWLR